MQRVPDLKEFHGNLFFVPGKVKAKLFMHKTLVAEGLRKDNWEELTAYFDFPLEIRKIIYTTNAIESLNSTIRKYTKVKTVFPDDQAAQKAVYLAIANIEKKWTMPMWEWGTIINQLIIKFGDRCGIL